MPHTARSPVVRPLNPAGVSLSILLSILLSCMPPLLEGKPTKGKSGALREFVYGEGQKMRVDFSKGEIRVQLQPRRGDGIYRFASWSMRDWKNNFHRIEQYNGNRPLRIGQYVSFPFRVLNPRMQGIALQALFLHDSQEEKGWTHRVMFPGETVSLVSGLFAKPEIGASRLIEYNRLPNQGRNLNIGDEVVIPWNWVRPELNLRTFDVKAPLFVKKERLKEPFAYYRLQKGESLYSAVIVRFTGRTLANDVNRMAASLMRLNGIKDARHIYAGAKLKIPIEWISEEYLIQSIVQSKPEIEKPPAERPDVEKPLPPARGKRPIHIILDAGHGGRDPGATYRISSRKSVFEDEIVHDICLRLEKLLKKEGYIIHPTLHDPDQKLPVRNLATKKDEDELLLVHPPYRIRSANVGINMRVFLINSIYRKLRTRDKIPAQIAAGGYGLLSGSPPAHFRI